MLSKVIKDEYIQLDVQANNFEEAIRKALQPFLEADVVIEKYVETILKIYEETGPYIVITENIALPHATVESGAKDVAIGFMRLKTPVTSGHRTNDPVKYLFSLSAKNNQAHIELLSELANLLGNPDFLKQKERINMNSHKALVACRAGVGSSLMLKIKVNEVVKENNFPLEVEHSSLDGVPGFQGDMIITLPDVANELIEKNLPQKIVGIANIVDKNEIKIKLEEAFIELEKQ